MKKESMQMGRIMAVLKASEDVITSAKKHDNHDVIKMAKESAYDHIIGIINDPAYCPWQE